MGWKLVKQGAREYYELRRTQEVYTVRDTDKLSNKDIEKALTDCDSYVDLGSVPSKLITYQNELIVDEIILPSGFYDYYPSQGYPSVARLEVKKVRTEEAYIPTANVSAFNSDVKMFLDSQHIYEEMKVQYRRGYLLYGPPGNGKTALIRSILTRPEFKDAQIIWCHAILPESFREQFNSTKDLKILVFEELVNQDGSNNYAVQDFLDMLDGESSMKNCIVIATTNYPELLAKNLADRPSRFDLTLEVGYPDKASVTKLLRMFLKDESIQTDDLDLTELSVAHIKEIALIHKMYGVTLAEAVDKMRQQSRKFKNHFEKPKAFGFNGEEP